MTYQEAFEKKETYSISNYLTKDYGQLDHVVIAPELKTDFLRFLEVFKKDFSLYNDSLAKEYSTDNHYEVRYHRAINQNL